VGQLDPSQSHLEVFDQHDWKAGHQGTVENSHTGHCAHCGSTSVKVQNVLSWEVTLHMP
jgi:hypothetical protein